MLRTMEEGFARIGSDLMQYATESAEFSASRGVVSELFPYIYAASRTMSSRAISRWLEEQQQIKLSAVTISKALREPSKHWIAYTDELEPSVRIFEEAFGIDPETFLRDYRVFDHFADKPAMISAGNQEEAEIGLTEVRHAVESIRQNWYGLPDTARKECIGYLLADESEEEKADENKAE